MSNTFDAALVQSTISEQAQTVLANRLAALSLFSSDFSTEVKKPKDTIIVPIVSATGATVLNPTDFEPGGGTTIGKESVVLDHVFQPFQLTLAEIQCGHRLERLVKINMDAIADKIWALATAPITVANYGAATVTTAAASITPTNGDLPKLWAAVAKSGRKGLVVNPTIYSGLIPTSTTSLPLSQGAYGFDAGVYFASVFGGQSGLAGFACAPEALAIASAAPSLEHVSDKFMISDSVTLDNLGMTIYYNVWSSTGNRALNASFEVMFGASKAITAGTMALIVPTPAGSGA